jgi:hypothetical protein
MPPQGVATHSLGNTGIDHIGVTFRYRNGLINLQAAALNLYAEFSFDIVRFAMLCFRINCRQPLLILNGKLTSPGELAKNIACLNV